MVHRLAWALIAGLLGCGSKVSPGDLPLADAGGEGAVDGPAPLDADSSSAFLSSVVLGRPTASSIALSAVPQTEVEVVLDYGVASGEYAKQSASAVYPGGMPFVAQVDGLDPDTRYYYRLRWRTPGADAFDVGAEHTFHTARPPGSSFTFAVQADPHLDDVSALDLYQRTLDNELADSPDFLIDLGDTFMCEKHSAAFDATAQAAPSSSVVAARYLFEHGNFSRIAHSVPLLLVNGNHEGESGWLLDGTANNLAVWATLARKAFFPVPFPDGFYSGSTTEEPFVGLRASWYSWTWGDALFIVLDPFWYTQAKAKTDLWVWTLGEAQYGWLRDTLQSSKAPFRFVFLHNLLGGLNSQARGGVEAAPFYEWGGANADGTPGFAERRPGWEKPVHRLFVDNHVTAVFHGHDHVYVKQELDGIVYQEVPQPSAPTFNNGPSLAAKNGYTTGEVQSSAGHLRVTVTAGETTVDYVRAYRPQDESGVAHNGDLSASYKLVPR